jgi:Uri superfamily endonuclease
MNSGAYQIFFRLNKEATVRIGNLGEFTFQSGDYVYTGSAMKNLRQRVARHLKHDKKLHWHIDYLLAEPEVEIQSVRFIYSNKKEECEINRGMLSLPGTSIPVNGFGSSDCRNCPSHLVKMA